MNDPRDFFEPLSKTASKAEIVEHNMGWYHMMRESEMNKEAQELLRNFLRAQVYEGSILEAFHPSTKISHTELDKDENPHNNFKIVPKEYISAPAIEGSMRSGAAAFKRVEGKRYRLNLVKIQSEQYTLKEDEVKVMELPIEEIIRTQIAFHLRKRMDAMFLGYLRAAIAEMGAAQVVDFTPLGIQRITPEVLVEARQTLNLRGEQDGLYMRSENFIMTATQYDNTDMWPQMNGGTGFGSTPGIYMDPSQTWMRDGYKKDRLLGMNVISTIKTDLFRHNQVWVLPNPSFMGHHYGFNDEKFGIKRSWDEISIRGYMSFMYGIGNAYSVGLCILAPRQIGGNP